MSTRTRVKGQQWFDTPGARMEQEQRADAACGPVRELGRGSLPLPWST